MTYEIVKRNWELGLWNKTAIKRAYAIGIITKEQYREIVALPQNGAV